MSDGNDQGIWWRPPNAPLKLVAREGARPPGAAANVRWHSFKSLVNTPRGPIFIAKLKGAATSKNDRALYSVGLDGTLREVLREGSVLHGKRVRTFTRLAATPGATGVTRQFSSLGEVVMNVTFIDGTQSIVSIATP